MKTFAKTYEETLNVAVFPENSRYSVTQKHEGMAYLKLNSFLLETLYVAECYETRVSLQENHMKPARDA